MDKSNRKTKVVFIIAIYALLLGTIIFLLPKTIENRRILARKESEYDSLSEQFRLYNEESISLKEKINEEKLKKINIAKLIESTKSNKEAFYKMILKLENDIYNGKSNKKIAYLTIDDGPNKDTTTMWLKILKDHNVLATFFVNGRDNLDNEYRRIIKEGHTIANHTYSHDIFGIQGVYSSSENFINQVDKLNDFIYKKFDYKMNLLRFPGGSFEISYLGENPSDYYSLVRQRGLGWINWNVSSGDGNRNQSSNAFINNVLNNSKNKSIAIVLMHDDSKNTIAGLEDIIDGLESMGFILLPLQYDSLYVIK